MAIENEFTMQELRDLREVFQVYDPSNTGSLTISDFRKVSFKNVIKLAVFEFNIIVTGY